MAKPIPDGYRTITPVLSVKGAAQAIDFYKDAFGFRWGLATHKEDLSPEETGRRAQAAFASTGPGKK